MNWWLFVLGFVVVWGLAFAWACWTYVLGYKRAEELGRQEADTLRAIIRRSDRSVR